VTSRQPFGHMPPNPSGAVANGLLIGVVNSLIEVRDACW